MRAMIWVTSLLGSGHFRRAALIGDALASRGNHVLLVSGGVRGDLESSKAVELLELPTLRSADVAFSRYLDADGNVATEKVWDQRSRLLREAYENFQPDVFVTEMFPFGRRRFNAELEPILRLGRQKSGLKSAASVRDILVSSPDLKRHTQSCALALSLYDMVLVHGDPSVVAFDQTFHLTTKLDNLLKYTGYIGQRIEMDQDEKRSGVVVSAGSGVVGSRLIQVAAEAAQHDISDRPWHIIGGSNFPEQVLNGLEREPAGKFSLYRFVEDLPSLMAQSEVSVSQAGYNSVTEAVMTRTPMVLVPFATDREDEQTTRATMFSKAKMAVHLPEKELSADTLLMAISETCALSPNLAVNTNGAHHSAGLIERLARHTPQSS